MPIRGPTQQSQTDKTLNLAEFSILNDKHRTSLDSTSHRKKRRRRKGRKGQQVDPACPDKITQQEGPPSLNNNPPSPIRRVYSVSKVQKKSTQSASNPSLLSKSVIPTMNPSQGATPRATSVGPEAAFSRLALTTPNPSMSSAASSSGNPHSQHCQPRAPQRFPPVPNPTYYSATLLEPKRLSTPQRLLIVLDLNGTLLYRETGSTNYTPRLFLENFIKYCIEQHVVLVWSSAMPKNVNAVCRQLFTQEQIPKLLGIWGRDTLDLTPNEYRSKTQVYKNLDRIWRNTTLAYKPPWYHQHGMMWSQRNTLLVDDSLLKASSQPYNHIEIPEFIKNNEEAKAQVGKDVLGQVTGYLEEARMWDNVSAFVRRKRFKIDREWAWDWEKDIREEMERMERLEQIKQSRIFVPRGWSKPKELTVPKEIAVQLSDGEDEEEDEEEGGVKLPSA